MLNRSRKISLLLGLTTAFCFVELVVGYVASSIALLADAFHMLSDILSMVIALYAIKLGKRKDRKPQFTYGWQRAEILGALINGVFLLALCFSIFLQAIERFLDPVEIQQPILLLSVGGLGLAVNMIGLFLFHEHGHGHSHRHPEKNSHRRNAGPMPEPADPPVTEIQNVVIVANASKADVELVVVAGKEDLPSPAVFTQSSAANPSSAESSAPAVQDEKAATEGKAAKEPCQLETPSRNEDSRIQRKGHMNMQGVFLHVLGDALGSVGVVTAGLIIWLTDFSWRFYADPVITLLFTAVTLCTTIPLVQSTCSILLQGVPRSIRIEDVHTNIMKINDVISIHELHLWTLSEHVWIASVHVKVSPSHFMRVATDIKRLMHQYGIHSTTVQPEFVHGTAAIGGSIPSGGKDPEKVANDEESGENACLLRCAEACTTTSVCCPP